MKRFLQILLSLVLIAGGLYGAWIGLEAFDDMRAGYRDELARSRMLNFTAQQRITDLLGENERLSAELDELRALPAFAELVEAEVEIEVEDEDLEESDEDVGHQIDTE